MVLKVVVLLSLLSLAWAQTVSPTSVVGDVAETTSIMVPNGTPTTMMTDPPTTMTTDPPPTTMPTELPVNASFSERLNSTQARSNRRQHFYCLNENDNKTRFPTETADTAGTTIPIYWALFIQYPVLSYLDSRRKQDLFNVVARLVASGGNSQLSSFNESDFCIGPVFHYRVSTYQESVLINIYFNGGGVVTPDSPSGVSIVDFNTAFKAGFNAAAADSTDDRVQQFYRRNALAINFQDGIINANFHPSLLSQNISAEIDPTLRAVLLGSYVGNTTIETATNTRMEFAGNPNPINYGLEPGDIVFAVFGGLFLTIVMGLVLLGFCIHPYFLA